MKPLITKRLDGNGYQQRYAFSRSELLAALPVEMLAAQEQILGNAHCNGKFQTDWRTLVCHMPDATEYLWMNGAWLKR